MSATAAPADILTFHYRCKAGGCKCEFEHIVPRANLFDAPVVCPRCKGEDVIRFVPGINWNDPAFTKQVSKYRSRTNVECNTLPLHYPGADSYSPTGKPRFNTLHKLKEAGKRFGLAWV